MAPLIGAGRPALRRAHGVGESWESAESPLRQKAVFSGPISGAFTAPPRGPRFDENSGISDEPLSAVRVRKEASPTRRRMAEISPVAPFRSGYRRVGVGNGPPFPSIMAMQVGRAAPTCRDLPSPD